MKKMRRMVAFVKRPSMEREKEEEEEERESFGAAINNS